MSKNKTFTGPLAEHIQNFLNEKRSLGYKYEEQERLLGIPTGDRKRRNSVLP